MFLIPSISIHTHRVYKYFGFEAPYTMWEQRCELWMREKKQKTSSTFNSDRMNEQTNGSGCWLPLMNMWIENALQRVIMAELLKHMRRSFSTRFHAQTTASTNGAKQKLTTTKTTLQFSPRAYSHFIFSSARKFILHLDTLAIPFLFVISFLLFSYESCVFASQTYVRSNVELSIFMQWLTEYCNLYVLLSLDPAEIIRLWILWKISHRKSFFIRFDLAFKYCLREDFFATHLQRNYLF